MGSPHQVREAASGLARRKTVAVHGDAHVAETESAKGVQEPQGKITSR